MAQKNLCEIRNKLKPKLNRIVSFYNIKLMYVFGSYAKDKNNKNSDLDIAVLLEKEYNPIVKLNIIGDLVEIFKRDDIDLVILNDANPVLRHQIIKHGKILYEDSEETKVNFEVKVLKEYMDMEHFRKTQMKYINQWFHTLEDEKLYD
ncbi:type VII toxin-antitoxin system MntA family adenylyltransferase antitoxin [Paramaledivibacter caminithermalis]|jgi:predicted nucleotidyltransferase|uniref:Polymerase beta nucleotidyltransferase domain-containing protein n=1 Tax=Paramaledivibacter caminithermalis (strain DSM 15212 / CIP 107654 / DViRD3) TaxID=1121301 RepID=A0A1M6K6S8_PARC5|nr:nucleotidyltransferase domain-containing protein [Paramaledivibacter caminithermalis]SHJ54540.1 hypothetical protein SAMN02745912_00286 [Paramaledivibacter caminithermalis DSM 15212]